MQGWSRIRPAGCIEGNWLVNSLVLPFLQAVNSRHVDPLVKPQIPWSSDPKLQFTKLEFLNWMA